MYEIRAILKNDTERRIWDGLSTRQRAFELVRTLTDDHGRMNANARSLGIVNLVILHNGIETAIY